MRIGRVVGGLALGVTLALSSGCDEDPAADGGPSGGDAGPACVPRCDGVACAADGCGGVCGCASGLACVDERCLDPSSLVDTRRESVTTGADGEVAVTVTVPAGARSFLVTATTPTDATLALVAIDDPTGARILRWEDWYDGDLALTNAFYASDPATVVNWPVRAVDPPLAAGDYAVTLGSYEADGVTPRPGIALDVTTMVSRDGDLSRGVVPVVLVYADGLDADPALVAATERAVAHWAEVWARAGLSLSLRYATSDLDPALPYPDGTARSFVESAAALAEPGEIVVVLGETVAGEADTYGIAGQIPGPLVPSALSVIVVGWLANAGGDGTFSDDDILLYGEVYAHEVGHYLGLFHPVEDGYDSWDALADTPDCADQDTCERVLGENLMFPYSICDGATCVRTQTLTADQTGVVQRYTGTL